MYPDDNNDPQIDWQKAQQLLMQAQQTPAASYMQGGQLNQPAQQAQPSNTWQQALDTVQKYQGQNAPAPRQMPAAEPAPQPDDSKTYWAMALSLLGNNGRDLGDITQRSADNYNKQLTDWEARNSPDAKLNRELKLAELSQADRAPQREAMQQAGQVAGIAQQDRQQNIQEGQFRATQTQQALLKQAEMIAHQADERYQQGGMNSRQEQQIAAENARQGVGIGAENARSANTIASENERARLQRENQLAIAGLSQANKVKAPITGVTTVDPARYATLTDAERTKADEAVNLGRSINDKLHVLHDLQLAPPSSANEKTYTNTINFLVGNASAVGNTGIVNKDEYLRYMQSLPAYAAVKTPQGKLGQITSMRSAMEVARGRNPSVEALSQIQNMFARQAHEAMRGYGITDALPGFDAKKSEPSPTQAAPTIQTQQIAPPQQQLPVAGDTLQTVPGKAQKVSAYLQSLQGDDELRKLGMSF